MSKRSTAVVALADAAVLVVLRPDLGELSRGLSAPRRWITDTGADLVVARLAGAALWVVAAWVALGLLAVLASHLPGAAGRLAAGVATVALPAVLRRIVVGSAGLGVLLAPVAAQAQTVHDTRMPAAPTGVPAPTSSVPASSVPGPSWPASPPAAQSASPPASQSPSLPGPAWPHGSSPTTSTPSTPPSTRPSTPPTSTPTTPTTPNTTPTPTRTSAPHTRAPQQPAPQQPAPAPTPTTRPGAHHDSRVTVRAGDCLWLIAAHRLGPSASDAELAAYLPQLYAANRNVIGDEPDLVTPGQVLDVPPAG